MDVPFAPFFLGQMLEHRRSVPYSSIDELSSMDPELYKSLNYIKVCNGSDLVVFGTICCSRACRQMWALGRTSSWFFEVVSSPEHA